MNAPTYIHLIPGEALPLLEGASPFKAIVVVETEVAPDWQAQVSDWLIRSGCRYMMAWGENCSDWDTSVDQANLARFDYREIPEDEFTMTTWHAKETLQETFWFSQRCAFHPSVELDRTYIVHIAPEPKATELLNTYRAAQQDMS